jgi:hypothetical protein
MMLLIYYRLCAMQIFNRSFAQLCRCLRGAPPKNIDWLSLIGLANDTLTTPALISFVSRFHDEIPAEVSRYIREMCVRNQYRNHCLSEQLGEALMALNGRGVTPVLFKGSARLATFESAVNAGRIISDLDIMISSEEVERTLECLLALGYRVFFQSPGGAAKWYVDLERHGDVGMIDLHQGLPGHNYFFRTLGNIRQYCSLITTQLGTAYVPFATYQALIQVVHDQFQDYDYWTGKIDLRHLLDLRDLATSAEGVDWKLLASLSPGELYRNGLETQLLTLHCLFNVDVPIELRRRLIPRLQFSRRLIQAGMPFLTRAFLATALLDYRNYRAEVGAEERRAKTSKPQRWAFPKMGTLHFLLDLSAKKRPGKV